MSVVVYWDTSALVRRWLGKALQRDRVNRLLATPPGEVVHASSLLLSVEVLGIISANFSKSPARATYVRMVERELGAFRLYSIDSRLAVARRLIRQHSIGGADAIHLATALLISRREQRMDLLACSDKALKAASTSRFRVWDPIDSDPPLHELGLV